MNTLVEKIKTLKEEKNAVILAHCYQNIEVDEVADFVGDSLYLSQKAKDTDADIIVFAGVSFMAETAKLLSPDKKVLLPRLEAGCFMADMINAEQLREFKLLHPNVPAVCYVNSTASVKAECDVCCTSSNALKVVQNLNVPEVLFLPDTYLGKWVESKLEGMVKVTTYNGFCPTHLRLRPEDVEKSRLEYPNSKILAHPECHQSVSSIADYVGSKYGLGAFYTAKFDTSALKDYDVALYNFTYVDTTTVAIYDSFLGGDVWSTLNQGMQDLTAGKTDAATLAKATQAAYEAFLAQ